MEALQTGSDTLFVLLGAILVLFMHAGFAFLEVGTVRQKNQVNALSKIFSDFAISTIAYFFIGYQIAYGMDFYAAASELTANNGYELVKFFFLLTFAAAIPAIISGGIAERAQFYPQLTCLVYYCGVWLTRSLKGSSGTVTMVSKAGLPKWLVPSFMTLPALSWCMAWVAGLRWALSFYWGRAKVGIAQMAPSAQRLPRRAYRSLALGAWILTVGWFGFNVMSAQAVGDISGLSRHKFPHGHGGWFARRLGCRQERPWLFAQRSAGWLGCRLRRFRCHAPNGVSRCRCHRRLCCSCGFSRLLKTSGKSTMY